MIKETTTKETTTPTTTKGMTFFEAVKVLLAGDMSNGTFEVLKLEEDGQNGLGQFRSTYTTKAGFNSDLILIVKKPGAEFAGVTVVDEITRQTYYNKEQLY